MAIGPGFYNQGDQELYAGGLQYLPQEQYRLSLGNNNQVNRLDFSNLSNSGIMSQAPVPYIYPLINQGGGGGGGGTTTGPATDNSGFDPETEAYGLSEMSAAEKGLTEEEQEALDAQMTGPQLGKLGAFTTIAGMMTAPLTTMGFLHRRTKKKQRELEEKTRQAGIQADFDRAMAQGQGFYDSLNDGKGASVSQESREQAGAGYDSVEPGSPFAYGGLAGLL
jgi:hypothetical protein